MNGKVYLSHGDDGEEAARQGLEVVNLRIKELNVDSSHTHAFFSTFQPSVLMESLLGKMNEQGQKFDISNQTWKLTLNLNKVLEADAEAAPQFQEQCKAQVEILKVPGQEKYCLNFSRKAGSAMLFYDFANKYMDMLELFNNTTLDE